MLSNIVIKCWLLSCLASAGGRYGVCLVFCISHHRRTSYARRSRHECVCEYEQIRFIVCGNTCICTAGAVSSRLTLSQPHTYARAMRCACHTMRCSEIKNDDRSAWFQKRNRFYFPRQLCASHKHRCRSWRQYFYYDWLFRSASVCDREERLLVVLCLEFDSSINRSFRGAGFISPLPFLSIFKFIFFPSVCEALNFTAFSIDNPIRMSVSDSDPSIRKFAIILLAYMRTKHNACNVCIQKWGRSITARPLVSIEPNWICTVCFGKICFCLHRTNWNRKWVRLMGLTSTERR